MNISWHMLNYSSILLFWQAPPTEHQNGIIREYHVELSGSNTSVHYTTEGPFLLVGNLKPNINYNSSIAAHTIMRGPLSESITILLRQEKYNYKSNNYVLLWERKGKTVIVNRHDCSYNHCP